MEFGLDQLRTGLRPGSSRFDLSRHVEIARTCSILVASHNLAYHSLSSSLARASMSATSLGPVCDQDSVLEFGFNYAAVCLS